jgi:hypothetical protein
MTRTKGLTLGVLSITVIAMVGCASSGQSGKAPEKANGAVFAQPLAKTQQAAVNALSVVGCDIKKQEPTYVEGHRPNKMGLFVGSGGETVKIWLESVDAQKTSVKVQTEKSLVGLAGQKTWDAQVIEEMKKSLGS